MDGTQGCRRMHGRRERKNAPAIPARAPSEGGSRGRGASLFARCCASIVAFALIAGSPAPAAAYAELTHEAVIDSAWTTGIVPVLLERFPHTTPAELKMAHAYAYGGSIIQDLGYYPHGNLLFTDLTHYVRAGDFVMALLRDSENVDDYAFALGALSHYVADDQGHRMAVNRAVPLLYPELERKYGSIVTYDEAPLAYLKTEFGFDVVQVAQSRYAPQSYHDFIGFAVSAPLLARAFQETYGLSLGSLFKHEDKLLGSYRHDISTVIPAATRVAWDLKKKQIQQDEPGITKRRFIYNISRASYRRNWGKDYQGPTLIDKVLAFLYKILPKVGPLKVLQFKTPTPETERLFEASFNVTMARYRERLREVAAGRIDLPNENLDLDELARPGIYPLGDKTEARLLRELASRHFSGVTAALRAHLLEYFSDPNQRDSIRSERREWRRVQAELVALRQAAPSRAVPATGPSN